MIYQQFTTIVYLFSTGKTCQGVNFYSGINKCHFTTCII